MSDPAHNPVTLFHVVLYGLGRSGQLYTLDTASAALTRVGNPAAAASQAHPEPSDKHERTQPAPVCSSNG